MASKFRHLAVPQAWQASTDLTSQASPAMNGAMRSASVAMTPGVTAAYNWKQFPVIADIRGGVGAQPAFIPRCFSHHKRHRFRQAAFESGVERQIALLRV